MIMLETLNNISPINLTVILIIYLMIIEFSERRELKIEFFSVTGALMVIFIIVAVMSVYAQLVK